MTGIDMARTQIRVRAVIKNSDVGGLPRLQPLYGIRRFTVDPELEIERGRPSWGGAHAADFRSGLDHRSHLDGDRSEIAVQRIVIAAMVEDYERPEAGKGVRIRHRTAVHGSHRDVLGGADLDAIFDGAASEPAFRLSEAAADLPGGRPIEGASEGQ